MEMLNTPTYLPPGAGDAVWIGSFGTIYKVPGDATGGAVAVVEHVLGPRQLGAPLNRHSREDEISYVLEGELTVQQGDRTDTAGVGGTIVKPRGVFHAFWNSGDTPLRFLEVIAPGAFAQYFRELAPLLQREGPADLAAIGALASRYGVEFDFASMPELLLGMAFAWAEGAAPA
jgi:mannose-6-phosphate isomerase-like protein (cupin superfamily)